MTTKLALVPLLLSGLLIEVTAHAADHSGVMPFMADDVVAIAYLDLRSIDVPALLDEMRDLGAVPLDQWDDVARDMSRAQRWFNNLVASGATRCYVLLRTSDLQHQGPTWVLPLTDNADNTVHNACATCHGE